MDDKDTTRARAREQREALIVLRQEGEETAGAVSEAFQEAGEAISSALEEAARSGALSFSDMAESILADLAELALDRWLFEPLQGSSEHLGAQLDGLLDGFIGQRAQGGPVLAGEPYLVGERGPEVFKPMGAGMIELLAGRAIAITIHAHGDVATGLKRSERQIAAAIARAASQGSRLL